MLRFLPLIGLFFCVSAQDELIEVGSFGNKGFYLYSRPFDTSRLLWTNAKQLCEKNDLTMAKIENEAENEFIQNNTPMDETYWIGGVKSAGINLNFNWNDGTRVEYSNFRETPIIDTGRNPTYIAVNNGVWIQSFSFISEGYGVLCQGEARDEPVTPETPEIPEIPEDPESSTPEPFCRAEALRMIELLKPNPINFFRIFLDLQNHLARCNDPELDREIRAELAKMFLDI